MSVKNVVIKTMGEGGAHLHGISTPEITNKDGLHKHLFFINERLLMTELSGAHFHTVDLRNNMTLPEPEPRHEHPVVIGTEEGPKAFMTKNASPHPHEIQIGMTTLSGLHTHSLTVGDMTVISLLPSDVMEEVEMAAKKLPQFKGLKLRKSKGPLEMDFETIKRLNKSDMKEVLKSAIPKAIFKSFARLVDGFQIESLVLNRDRFDDIGVARRFVVDQGLNPRSSNFVESEGVFVFSIHEKDNFVASTLHRIQISDGVFAVVGLLSPDAINALDEDPGGVSEGKPEDVFPENATRVDSDEKPAAGTLGQLIDPVKNKGKKVKLQTISRTNTQMKKTPLKKRFDWKMSVFKAVDHTNTHCKFCGITADEENQAMGLGLLCSICFNCAVEREEKGVFEQCISGTFDFDKYKEENEGEFSKVKSFSGTFQILKAEKRLVMGPILIPENIDLQNDIISVEEIERAAHNYMIKLAFNEDQEFLAELGLNNRSERGFMHTEFNRKIAFVESYLAPVEFRMNRRKILKGTWIGVAKVFDDEVWNLVKTGKINGFSIGGTSRMVPEKGA